MSKNVGALKATLVCHARSVLAASTATVQPHPMANAAAVRAATTKRTASSSLTIESSATVVEDLAAAIAKFKVNREL